MRYLVDALYLMAAAVFSPVLAWRMAVQGKSRNGWAQRFGFVPRRDRRGGGQGGGTGRPLIWIHAVSVGEANATRTLVAQLARKLPDCELAFSATTDTGFARLGELYPSAVRFFYPWDFSFAVRRALARLRPSMIVLMELEVWPNLLKEAQRFGVPVAVVNGRLSEKSFAWYRRVGRLVRPMFSRLTAVCAQDETYAARFAALGTPADRIVVTGSVKYDTADAADRVAGADSLARAMGLKGSPRLLVAGSTGPGEEEILLGIYAALRGRHPALRLAVVPRKPERFDEVAGLIEKAGFRCRRRSGNPDSASPPALDAETIVLGDTMGELRKFYGLASLVFVGRSLVPMGGSDVMEAAALGRAVLTGPHATNFAEPVARLTAAGGLQVVQDGAALQAAVDHLLANPSAAGQMAAAARQAVLAARGATARTVEVVGGLLR